jgi:predicted transport protein
LEQEYDTLSQRLTQEIVGMKDSIKGMLNEYSIATREDQRIIDILLQELNYKISVSLNSDGKTAIDSIRWMLTRRAALTIASCACASLMRLE